MSCLRYFRVSCALPLVLISEPSSTYCGVSSVSSFPDGQSAPTHPLKFNELAWASDHISKSDFYEHGWFCRYGGEELAVLFEVGSGNLAISLLEALRHCVEHLDWREDALRVTLSGGVAVSKKDIRAKELINAADIQVYNAKRDGKNRIYECISITTVHDTM
ncbi:hypothetical protein CF114_15760 [Aeromonas veronii]|nr:hypothetical protein CF114_15760 [Aeromonas veronii]